MNADLAHIDVTDAHQHFWDLGANPYPWLQAPEPIPFRYGDYAALRRNYLPADYRRDSAGCGVVRTVHVEAEWDRTSPVRETAWLDALADAEGLPTVIVGHARFEAPDATEVVAQHAACARVRGIRQKPTAAAAPAEAQRGLRGSMDDPAWRRGYAALARHGLSYDLQTPWWHLDAAAALARDVPETTVILNHTGLPADRSAEGLAAWRRAMAALADCPNAALKISGLGFDGAHWSTAANVPVMREAIAIFGAERCMFASNYPVDSLVASYGAILAAFREAIAHRPLEQQRMLLSGNSERIYRIPIVATV
ncbi:MAG TPA: amidohydrolase family protein [Acetobacteraceae bacterium]|jgi:predicted TIM-barrel fold metal-dependent hydrolase|nr:amidohydrolase family protein [Acetobacteraceae bacterium]